MLAPWLERGEAVMIAGGSESGKTSVLTALLQRGYRLVCDDYGIVRISDRTILALPDAVTMPFFLVLTAVSVTVLQ
ncbi:MAG TPA: hypothetical protein PLO37_15250 [Candidatus Hydrogenedentes bacterium]|nr:hypothetical protein [Candidatus Hydrogenedentota bacterium]HPG68204.1 hypothetical protein [Candidatus Hydrogenedentota bacterium]